MHYNVLITGANSGLGKSLAIKFKLEGHFVFEHLGHNHFDLSEIEDIELLIKEEKSSKVNVLINNAAILCPNIEFSNYDTNKIASMINVNLLAPILLIHGLKDQLLNVININSMVALETKKNRMIYSASKCGLSGFSESLKISDDELKILDVYSTNIKTNTSIKNAMELDFVVNSIYRAFINQQEKLILDGRN
jgi:short-subunit dehydrogenase